MTVRIRAVFASGGVPVTGLTPTISIWPADAGSGAPVVDAATMTEMAPAGEYSYEFAGYDSANEYVWQIDGGDTLADVDRYQSGSTAGAADLSALATAAALASLQGTANAISANAARIPANPATQDAVTALGTPLQAGDYTAPDNATIGSIAASLSGVATSAQVQNMNDLSSADVVAAVQSALSTSGIDAANIASAVETALMSAGDGQDFVSTLVAAIGYEGLDVEALVTSIRGDIERVDGLLAATATKEQAEVINDGVKKASLLIPHAQDL